SYSDGSVEKETISETKFEKYIYEVTFENRTSTAIYPLKAEYRIFYEQEVNDSGTGKVIAQQMNKAGELKIDRVDPTERFSVETEPVVLQEYEFNSSDFYFDDGDPSSTGGDLKGFWLRLSITTKSGMTAVRDVYYPDSIRGKYVW
uniref:hypothetical protein n=1 Tax=Pontiella sp. TaxID=2837462 RepID=UPI003562AAA6